MYRHYFGAFDHRFSLGPSMVFFGLALVGGAAVSWQQFSTNLLLVDLATPALSVFLTFLTAAFFAFLETARERREVRNAFQYYLAPDMVEQVASDPDKLKLGGETRDLTILFCDIRGFTSISEAFADAPEKLTHIINIFLTGLSKVIQDPAAPSINILATILWPFGTPRPMWHNTAMRRVVQHWICKPH